MEVYAVGYNFKHDKSFLINRPAGFLDFYTIILTQTSGIFRVNNEEITVPANSFIFYDKESPQYFKSNTTYIHNWIHFTLDENDDYIFKKGIELNKLYHLEDVNTINQLFELINQEFFSENLYKLDSVKLYFDLIFTKISEQIHSPKLSATVFYKENFNNLRSDIYNFPSKKWTVKTLAESVDLSESYFQHLYKKYFGISVMSDVISARIKTAKQLLITTSKPLHVIAEELGYNSTTLFTRQFKAVTSISPGVYRKNNMMYGRVYDG